MSGIEKADLQKRRLICICSFSQKNYTFFKQLKIKLFFIWGLYQIYAELF